MNSTSVNGVTIEETVGEDIDPGFVNGRLQVRKDGMSMKVKITRLRGWMMVRDREAAIGVRLGEISLLTVTRVRCRFASQNLRRGRRGLAIE